jgi:hypothetical protein
LEWVDARLVETAVVEPELEPTELQVVDHRAELNPREVLERIRSRMAVQVWSEGEAKTEVGGLDRTELEPSTEFVVWTVPPGPRELQGVLRRVAPEVVYVFGNDPELDDPQRFLRRLSGLVKRGLRSHGGRVSLSQLAAGTSQREAAVRLGLDWLAEHGDIAIIGEGGEEIRLAASSRVAGADLEGATVRLRSVLEETAAYRAHFVRSPVESLVRL